MKRIGERITEVKNRLELSDEEMAKQLNINVDTYRAITKGARQLPIVAQKAVERRLERMLSWCGLK